ncbi:MAG: hypothetical protein PG981_000538 [Wolbachia endosymbiont of Ctenocephalides orientis wCori]|nr:MAG: hypothetical protein PG981_000538 [Wolbachia endosymbiont of Ctenocephalides orientis wCori]
MGPSGGENTDAAKTDISKRLATLILENNRKKTSFSKQTST